MYVRDHVVARLNTAPSEFAHIAAVQCGSPQPAETAFHVMVDVDAIRREADTESAPSIPRC